MKRFRAKTLIVEAGPRGQSSVSDEVRGPMLLLLGVTGFVLLIACANIANLLLRAVGGRATEMAVRLSIGASRRHLIAQLLTESFVLAMIGGFAGLVVARWTLDAIASLLPPDELATLHSPSASSTSSRSLRRSLRSQLGSCSDSSRRFTAQARSACPRQGAGRPAVGRPRRCALPHVARRRRRSPCRWRCWWRPDCSSKA